MIVLYRSLCAITSKLKRIDSHTANRCVCLTTCLNRANLRSFGKIWVLMFVVLVSVPLIAQTPKVQASTVASNLGNKALSFLSDVIQLDIAKYKVTLYENESNGNHLFYKLYPNDASAMFFPLRKPLRSLTFTTAP